MAKPWIFVIGIGEDGFTGLSMPSQAAINGADVLFGGERQLALVPVGKEERILWKGLEATIAEINRRRGKRLVILASGDPMWFGIGASLAKRFSPEEMRILSHPGSFSLAAARLGWPLQEVTTLTAHGRSLEAIALHFAPNARLLILSHDKTTPGLLRQLLNGRGYGPSRIIVLERLGGPLERMTDERGVIADLNLIAVECHGEANLIPLSRNPGLPDEAYYHDGQITKHEVRAVTLSALSPLPGALLWDVGAGSGSIAIEWMRAGGRAIAYERDNERAECIRANAARLGVPSLEVVRGEVPDCFTAPCEAPDAVFVGGGVSDSGVLETVWAVLKPGGRLVVNAVTSEGESALLAFHVKHGGSLSRLAISRLVPMGAHNAWKSLAPVTQYVGRKK
jgi:precorrin-6Y C5,15-methyltransferase (decarboxylating)